MIDADAGNPVDVGAANQRYLVDGVGGDRREIAAAIVDLGATLLSPIG